MSRVLLFYCIFVCALVQPAVAQQHKSYDLIIQNGRVMDPESELDAVRSVGIRNGKISK